MVQQSTAESCPSSSPPWFCAIVTFGRFSICRSPASPRICQTSSAIAAAPSLAKTDGRASKDRRWINRHAATQRRDAVVDQLRPVACIAEAQPLVEHQLSRGHRIVQLDRFEIVGPNAGFLIGGLRRGLVPVSSRSSLGSL